MNRKRKIHTISLSMSSFEHVLSMIPFKIFDYCNRNDILKMTVLNKQINKIIKSRFINNKRYHIEREENVLIILKNMGFKPTIKVGDNGAIVKMHLIPSKFCSEDLIIPDCISEFIYLDELIFRSGFFSLHNKTISIKGKIPPEIGLLKNLCKLDIKEAKLVTTIPNSMKMMTKLNYLDLIGNVILGEIPRSFFKGSTGPLRNDDSWLNIWNYHGPYYGSILNLPYIKRSTPFHKLDENDPDDEVSSWFSFPTLRRQNAIRWIETWFGGEYT